MAMFEDDGVMILCCLDCASREMREIADLRPLFASAASSRYGCHVSAVVADADGDLWIGTQEEIVVVSPEGEKRCSVFGLFNQPMRLAAAPDGTVWLAETARILIFDKQTPNQVRRLTPEIPPDPSAISVNIPIGIARISSAMPAYSAASHASSMVSHGAEIVILEKMSPWNSLPSCMTVPIFL